MYNHHPALADNPTGQPILSGHPHSPSCRRSVAALEANSEYTDSLRESINGMLFRIDVVHKLDWQEHWRLASNVQFLINKEMNGTPKRERCNAMIVRGEGGFRIEIDVGTTTVVEGEWEDDDNDAIVGFRKKVDEMVYGKREEYMGPNESAERG